MRSVHKEKFDVCRILCELDPIKNKDMRYSEQIAYRKGLLDAFEALGASLEELCCADVRIVFEVEVFIGPENDYE